MSEEPSADHQAWALYLRDLLGGEVSVKVYYDDAEEYSIPILTSTSDEGVVCATIGLMEVDQSHNPELEINTEIILDKRGADERVPNLLATLAFQVIKNEWRVAPGVVFKDITSRYFPETNLPHVYFTTPFQWRDMSKIRLPKRSIYPLVAIPVSREEDGLASQNSGRVLEERWTKRQVDVLNWNRECAG